MATDPIKTHRAGRNLGLWGATFAAVLAMSICTGCNDSVRREVRQGAYEVFSAGLDVFYSELGAGITNGISELGQAASDASAAKGS
ncbi:MAG TPA: hypothetical protein PK920_01335 [Phycisphaerae bacterium]|jgi:hypothetical protein|nr:hypothetical protein [Phycisphaerae bacterium]HPC21101.1 hypothetical protein [Phycisphaerae bacterium]HRS26643.1 hypothetical protein [Phycisphaerae bacterium]